ncbi:MAG: phytanoyl-CoA dioxygenase family protein [Betaproteobacteria bacterium]|nr:phytanoyl-CoA dioxygenase family protein [Betaproteobacteria bacterium]MBV9361622.1 phytanoyl-CoA dioxygenase family protein [Betaproteobacteria bacterium]
MLARVDCKAQRDWLAKCCEAVRTQGCCIVDGVLAPSSLGEVRDAMYRAQERILAEVGAARLERAGERGVLRLMMKFEPRLLRFLELPELLAIVDEHVSPTAILHLQNGFILPPEPAGPADIFQQRFHQDFPRVLNGYLMSINAFFAIDEFTAANGATWVLPGSHQRGERPGEAELRTAQCVECGAGAMLVFDSTLWHCAGRNHSGKARLAINHQFTRSYIKQQIDYVRALGDSMILDLPARTQQLLGYYTRVVTSLDEYYRPGPERLYRSGQG